MVDSREPQPLPGVRHPQAAPFPTYQPGQLFPQAPDVILEFLLLDPPLGLVDLTAQVPLRPRGVAIGLQKQHAQFVQAPGGGGGHTEHLHSDGPLPSHAPQFAKCLETGHPEGGRWLLRQHLCQEGPERKYKA